MRRLQRLLVDLTGLDPVETGPTLTHATSALFFSLCAYFSTLPLRDDGGLSSGIPLATLFLVSLPVSLTAAPAAGALLAVPPAGLDRRSALKALFACLATGYAVLGVFASTRPGRVLFYLFQPASNLVANATLWARAAHVLGPTHTRAAVGVLSAAATAGQLAGSAVAGALALAARSLPRGAPAAVACACMLAARRHAGALKGGGGATAGGSSRAGAPASPPTAVPRWSDRAAAAAGDARVRSLAAVMASASALSAWGYLLKAGVVAAAAAGDSAARLQRFAAISGAAAAATAVLQATSTAGVLAKVPLASALCAQPAAAAAAAAAVVASPTVTAVAAGEVVRKAAAYVVARPAREAAAARLPPALLYDAKLTLEVAAPRAGDAIAALLARALGGRSNALPPRLAAAVALPLAGVAAAVTARAAGALEAVRAASPGV